MNPIVLFIEALATFFFLTSSAVLIYMFARDNSSSSGALSLAFFLMFLAFFLILLSDARTVPDIVRIVASTLAVFAGLIFLYIQLREELSYKTLKRIRGAV